MLTEAFLKYNRALEKNSKHAQALAKLNNLFSTMKITDWQKLDKEDIISAIEKLPLEKRILLQEQCREEDENKRTLLATRFWESSFTKCTLDSGKLKIVSNNLVKDYIKRARLFYQKKNYSKAIEDFNKVLRIDPKNIIAWGELGIIHFDLKQYSEAIWMTYKVLEIDPQKVTAHFNLGFIYFTQKKYQDADSAFSAALKINPKYALAYKNRGENFRAQGKLTEAFSDFNEALKNDPKHQLASHNLITLLSNINSSDLDQVDEKTFFSAIEKIALTKRVEILKKCLDKNTPIGILDKIRDKIVDIYIISGDSYYKQNKHDNAISNYKSASECGPNKAIPYFKLGMVYRAQMKFDDSILYFEIALKINPSPITHYNLGILYKIKRMFAESVLHFDQVLKINPNDKDAHDQLEKIILSIKHGDLDAVNKPSIRSAISKLKNHNSIFDGIVRYKTTPLGARFWKQEENDLTPLSLEKDGILKEICDELALNPNFIKPYAVSITKFNEYKGPMHRNANQTDNMEEEEDENEYSLYKL